MGKVRKEWVRGICRGFQTPEQLRGWVEGLLGLKLPGRAVCAAHQAPMDYLSSAYFEPARDLVVWAPRGGGKTRLGAVATLLDLLHKPGCQVRILGGSLEQSLKMWEHLWPDAMRLMEKELAGRPSARRIELQSGSTAAVLTQSQRAVRGLRVQKLRCDEVELFDPAVWQAAQLVTRSARQRGRHNNMAGVVEALSTLHTPYGLMQQVVEEAQAGGIRVIRWCLLEVLERCEPERPCKACPLFEDCRGIAKSRCEGFVRIDDAIAMKRRVSRETWEAEMLCKRPSVKDCVFGAFDPALHVRENAAPAEEMWLAIDFGYANPFVCLWVAAAGDGTVQVVDEYVQEQRMVHEHIAHIQARPWPARKVACDPAGAASDEQTATSNVQLLREAGFAVKYRGSRLLDGIEMVRCALRPASGPPRLFVHPRCTRLIKALRSYRYGPGGSELPLKDGQHDHLIDALRYYYVNARAGAVVTRRY